MAAERALVSGVSHARERRQVFVRLDVRDGEHSGGRPESALGSPPRRAPAPRDDVSLSAGQREHHCAHDARGRARLAVGRPVIYFPCSRSFFLSSRLVQHAVPLLLVQYALTHSPFSLRSILSGLV